MPDLPTAFQHQLVFLYTDRFDETQEFCERVMGFKLVLDQTSCRVYQTASGGYLGYCHRSDAPATEHVIVTLVVDQVDAWYEHLCKKGVAIDSAPTLNEKFMIYHFFFRDPAGYRYEIQQFIEPFPPNKEM